MSTPGWNDDWPDSAWFTPPEPRPSGHRGLIIAGLTALGVCLLALAGLGAYVLVSPHHDPIESTSAGSDQTTTATQTAGRTPAAGPSIAPAGSSGDGYPGASGASCDPKVINADLDAELGLSPSAPAHVIDCEAGWAVFGSAYSGDPFWVASSGGRWHRVTDISIYTLTCPDQAIARGVPSRMAHRHLTTCATSRSSSTSSSSRASSTPSSSPSPVAPSTSAPVARSTVSVPTTVSGYPTSSSVPPTTRESIAGTSAYSSPLKTG